MKKGKFRFTVVALGCFGNRVLFDAIDFPRYFWKWIYFQKTQSWIGFAGWYENCFGG